MSLHTCTKHVASLLLLFATHALAFPFYMDVGGLPNTTLLSPTVPNVEYHHIFECPHPCGLVSHFDQDGTAINGGIPQAINMSLHLSTVKATFDRFVLLNESRYMDFDFEEWNPVWERNSNDSNVRVFSLARVRKLHPTWSDTYVENAAKEEFESAAQTVLLQTMVYMRQLRPSLRIGMYGYPSRFYYQGYNSSQGDMLREQNDNLFPLWCGMDAILPTVYQFYNSCNNSNKRAPNEQYVRSNVREAVRLSKAIQSRCYGGQTSRRPPPVFVYTWHRYHDGIHFVCDQDEMMTWNISVEEGADAVVLWGDERGKEVAFASYWTHDFAPMALAWAPPVMKKMGKK